MSPTFAFRCIRDLGESNNYLAKDNKDIFPFKAQSPAERIY